MIANDPPNQVDFLSHLELSPDSTDCDQVELCGLSIMNDKTDIPKWRKRFPKLAERLSFAAIGNLEPRHGKVKPTPRKKIRSHHTWWKYDTVDPSPDFTIMRGE
jgi:hypothetical protein